MEKISKYEAPIDDINKWLYHRIRMYIWKQWKKPKTKKKNLMKLGIPEYFAHQEANSRRKHCYVSGMGVVNRALTKERLINSGSYNLATAYQSVHINYLLTFFQKHLRLSNHGIIGVIDNKARRSSGHLLNLLFLNIIHFHLIIFTAFGIVGG